MRKSVLRDIWWTEVHEIFEYPVTTEKYYERIIEEHFFFKFDQYRNKARLSLLRWQNGKFTETLVVVIEFTKAST